VHLLLVRDVGRFQLLRFVVLMQFGRHLSLPFVEYVKVMPHLLPLSY
jgi:sphingosine kinase